MTLYQIDNALSEALDSGYFIDEETGEVLQQEKLEEMLENKIEDWACYIKNLKAEAEAIKQEKQALNERQKQKEAKASRLTDILKSYMIKNGKKKIETPKALISIRNSKSLVIENETMLLDYLTKNNMTKLYDIKVSAKKKEIKEALKDDNKLNEYAHIQENQNINIK